ncbi:MAG: NAD(P)/FAD-dependent oxidoreductase [Planktomarina sp.]
MSFLYTNEPAGTYPGSWYANSADLLDPLPPLRGAAKADVAIIGAGYTGLSTALHLAQAGFDVVVLDAHRVGFGASGRNGGQVGSGFNWPQCQLEKRLGQDTARKLWDTAQEAKALVHSLVTTHAPDAGIKPGVAHADFHANDTKAMHREADRMARVYGYDGFECLDKAGLQQVVHSGRYKGGVIDWGAWHLHPLRYALGLARACVAAGVRIYEMSPVHHIKDGAPNVVRTNKGHVDATWVIHATNGYSTSLNRPQSAKVWPINNYVVATEPLADPSVVLAKDIAVADNRFVLNYYRLSHDGRLIFGGGESYGKRFPDNIADKVRSNLEDIFPQLTGIGITHAWGGTLAITPTRLPMMARVGRTQLAAAGYSGHGVALATLAGKAMGHVVQGQEEQFDLLGKLPVPNFTGGQILRAPILTLAMTWFGMRDRIGI